MILQQFRRITALPLWLHAVFALAAVAWLQWIEGRLTASYAASKHPVDYRTGQLAFDGNVIKGYYASMIEGDTLDIYWATQFIDFGFILAMACMGLFFCTLIARASRLQSWGRTVGLLAGVSLTTGAICDAIENLWSFVMLSNPTGFANWLAMPYSTFAAVKFALITFAMILLIVSIVLAVAGRALKRPQIG